VLALLVESATTPGRWDAPRIAGIAVFVAIVGSDWLDGYLARRLDVTSRWGSSADALADRLALLAPLVYLAVWKPDAFTAIPLWVPLWLILMDAAVAVGWAVARWRHGARQPGAHNRVGRIGASILFLLVLWALLGLPGPGVYVLGLTGLVLVTGSTTLYIRSWLDGR
jgi:CDP-diacylglycerol--glycerol-3-phosphate 3-phosphatidyltransferase